VSRGRSFLVAALAALTVLSAPAAADIRIRVSVKLLYDDTVNPPIPPGGNVNRDTLEDADHCSAVDFDSSAVSCALEIQEKFAYVNRVMADLGRGYSFEVVEIIPLYDPPAPPPSTGVDAWTFANVADDEDALNTAAASDTSLRFRNDMLNVYVFDTIAGGFSDNVVVGATNKVATVAQDRSGSWPRFFHELGHNLGLFHTHGVTGNPNPCDGVCDTQTDNQSWDHLDTLSVHVFGATFANLTCPQQQQVFDLIFNIMAYHGDNGNDWDCRPFVFDSVRCGITNAGKVGMCRYRLTPDQLDRMTNRLNNLHTIGVVSGRTVFVNRNYNPCTYAPNQPACGPCPCDQAPRKLNGDADQPETTVASALAKTASDGAQDVVLIRGGNYNEQLTISQPVQLRATRGVVKIGRP